MEKLTDYIKQLKDIDKIRWESTVSDKGIRSFPFPVYPKAVIEFQDAFYSSDKFKDFNYKNNMNENGWYDIDKMEKDIPSMTKNNIATCITAIIRGEKFCDGRIAQFIENGILVKLLERLNEIEKD